MSRLRTLAELAGDHWLLPIWVIALCERTLALWTRALNLKRSCDRGAQIKQTPRLNNIQTAGYGATP